MSVCPSETDADALRTLPRRLADIGFDPAPRPVWPVAAQMIPARLAYRPKRHRPEDEAEAGDSSNH